MKICDFCGKSQDEVARMITSTKADICNNCILLCMEVLLKELKGVKEENIVEIQVD